MSSSNFDASLVSGHPGLIPEVLRAGRMRPGSGATLSAEENKARVARVEASKATQRPIDEDWWAWQRGLTKRFGLIVHPDHSEPGGLPDGWTIWLREEDSIPNVDALVIRRDIRDDGTGGEWLQMRHRRVDISTVRAVAKTFAGLLFESTNFEDRDAMTPEDSEHWYRSLCGLVVRSYDPDDEVERVEQTLVALGAPVTVVPRLLL